MKRSVLSSVMLLTLIHDHLIPQHQRPVEVTPGRNAPKKQGVPNKRFTRFTHLRKQPAIYGRPARSASSQRRYETRAEQS